MPGVTLVNAGDLERDPRLYGDERRVLEIQAKLHQWARSDPHRRFDDLFGLVCDLSSSGLRGVACGATGVPGPPGSTG